MTDRVSKHTWLYAVIMGSIVNILVFVLMPILKDKVRVEDELLVFEIQSWQPVEKQVVKKIKAKRKPRPKPKQAKKTQAKPKPPAETVRPKDPTPSPEKLAKIEEPEELTPAQDILPIPTPIFKLTEMAHFIHEGKLVYPKDKHQLGKEAIVKLDVLIDSKGKVRKVTVHQSAGDSFDQAAMDAIRRSSFSPARKKGKPVAMVLRVPIRFNLE